MSANADTAILQACGYVCINLKQKSLIHQECRSSLPEMDSEYLSQFASEVPNPLQRDDQDNSKSK
jgi:hypothetical protein